MDEDLLQEFIAETSEGLDALDDDLVKLEGNPNDQGVIDRIFRVIHTIKGTCGFLSLKRLEKISHATENLLGKFRSRELEISSDLITLVLSCVDRIRFISDHVGRTSTEPDGSDEELIGMLDHALLGNTPIVKNEQALKPAPVQEAAPLPTPTPTPQPVAAPPSPPSPPSQPAPEAVNNAPPSESDIEDAMIEAEMAAYQTQAAPAQAQNSPMPFAAAPSFNVSDDDDGDDFDSEQIVFEDHSSEAPDVIATAFHAWHAVKNKFDDGPSPAESGGGSRMPDSPGSIFPTASGGGGLQGEIGGDTGGDEELSKSSDPDQTVRVRLGLIEHLMTTVSELVLTRNQLMQLLNAQENSNFAVSLNRLNIITNELQDSVMKTRMQPIRVISSRINRTVRDLQRELNKQLKLVIYGGDTEIDRQLMEVLRDPIMHIIRNAADHGIESLQARRNAKKPDHGTITFTASQQDGHIIIRISDDGGGIDPQRLRETIIKRGLATAAELDSQRDYQLYGYMFLPGFSTAAQVSSVSGRGVGLDVVKSNIDNIGGVVEVTSQINIGTTFVVKLPLTLAIVDSLIVKIAGERFAVPQISIVELVHIRAGGDHYIDHVQNTPVLRLRDRMFPLVSIRQLLGLTDEDPEASAALPAPKESAQNAWRAKTTTTIDVTPEEAETEAVDGMEAPTSKGNQRRTKSSTAKTKTRQQRSANKYLHEKESFVIVTKVGSMEFGMIVDLVFDTEQIVVKPTSSVLRDIPFFNGNTILGDGHVIMILDPNGVVSSVSEIDSRKQTIGSHDNTLEYEGNRVTYLLFAADDETQKAVPVGVVSRLDEINLEEVEYPNHRPALQYRGSLMPLIDLHGIPNLPSEGKAQVIVFASDDQAVGLIVERVIDITDSIHEIQGTKDARGILGSSVVNGKATDIIDSQYYWNLAFPGQRELRLIGGANSERERPTVVLIDPNTFFRDLLVPYITAEGYRVIPLSDTKTALDLCNRGQHASVILLDIDHNNNDAFAFIHAIDNNSAWSATPVYGLSENPNQATRNISEQRLKFINFFDKRDSGAILESISSHH